MDKRDTKWEDFFQMSGGTRRGEGDGQKTLKEKNDENELLQMGKKSWKKEGRKREEE